MSASGSPRAARTAAAPLLTLSSSSSVRTASSTSGPPTQPRTRPTATADAQHKHKRLRQGPSKPKLDGAWWPVLASRSGTGRGCGHYVFGTPAPSTRIAAFDLDGTVIRPLDGKSFPKNSYDWEFCSPQVVPKLRATYRDGYSLVLISNQASPVPSLAADFRRKIPFVARKIGVPLRVFACYDFDEYRKPAAGMWEVLTERFNGGLAVDYSQSFYVGDAAGRASDHADTDRKFALNAGLPFFTPEQYFHQAPVATDWTLWGWHPHAYDHSMPPPLEQVDPALAAAPVSAPELVFLVGPPAVGKSAYAAQLEEKGYLRVSIPTAPNSLTVPSFFPTLHAALGRATESGAPGLILDTSLPSRRSRAALLAALRASPLCALYRTRCVVWTSSNATNAAGTVMMGSREDTRDLLELAKHNAVFRLAHSVSPSGSGAGMGVGLTPLKEFVAWEKAYEPPSLAEGFARITPVRFAFDPARSGGVPLERWRKWWADVYPGKAKRTGRIAVRGVVEAERSNC